MQSISRKVASLLFAFLGPALFPAILFAQSYDCEEELFARKDKKTRLFGYVNALGEYRVPPVFLKAMPFAGKTAIVQQGNRFGLINCDGILVVPAEYEEIASFSNGKGWVKKNGLFGLMNEQGRMLIQPAYEEVKEINAYNGNATWVKKAGLWGLISKENGRMLLTPNYEDVSVISDSAAIGRKASLQDLIYSGDGRIIISGMRSLRKVAAGLFVYESKDRKFGAFNSLAFTVLRPEFSSIRLNWNFLQTKQNGKSGLRSLKGLPLTEEKFDSISSFVDGFSMVRWTDTSQIIDSRGKWNLPAGKYEQVNLLNGGFALVQKEGKTGFWIPEKKSWNTRPQFDKVEVAAGKDWMRISRSEGGFFLQEARDVAFSRQDWDFLPLEDPATGIRAGKAGKVYLISVRQPAPVTPYEEISALGAGFYAARSAGKTCLLSGLSAMILPLEFTSIRKISTSAGIGFLGNKAGKVLLFSDKGKALHQGEFDKLLPASGKRFIASSGGKWGIAKADGAWLLENRFDSAGIVFSLLDEVRFPVVFYRKGKAQLLDESGKEISSPALCRWLDGGEGKLFRLEDASYYLFDAQGKRQGELEFEDFRPFSEGNAMVKIKGNWGFINHSGRLVIPARFSDALPFQAGIAYASENGLWGVLRKNGSWLVKPSGVSVSIDAEGKRRLVLP